MEIPRSRTLRDLLDEMAARYPDREAVVSGKDRLTYRQYQAQVRQLAGGLLRFGVAPGDKVALLMDNRTEWLLVDFAVAMLGATLVPVSTWSTARELAYVLRHSEASTLITIDRFLGRDYIAMLGEIGFDPSARRADEDALRASDVRFAGLRRVACLSREARPGLTRFGDLWELGALVSDAEIDAGQRTVRPEDVAYILYTSGTTSTPKGVPLQHVGLIENMFNIGQRQHLTEADRLWLGVSLFWGFGCENALLAVMTHGGCVVLQDHFEPGEALRLIERERCSVYYGTPNITLALTEHPERRRCDLRSLRTGATIGPPPAIRMVMDLGATEICNVYGLTECYGNCAVTDAHDSVDVRLHTVGRPLPGTEIRIADPGTHRALPPGEVGEITIRGYMMPGYYRDPEKNAAAFDADGWFLTGDFGTIDVDGRLRFRGRFKEMVKTGGLNVAPLEVEEVLLTHHGVEEAHVIGLPDARREEIVAAVVVAREGHAVSADDLREFCRKALAAFKVPQRFRFMARDELPLTASGKVQKHRLREMLAAELAEPESAA